MSKSDRLLGSFETAFGKVFLEDYQRGVMRYQYRGVNCLKSPIDISLYLQLLWFEKPATIFEIGSKEGGSALLLRDLCRMFGIVTTVVSIDIKLPALNAEGIHFIQGNVHDLEQVFASHDLFAMPRPWLVIEDSAHSYSGCMAALKFFAGTLVSGEYLVIEDGVLTDLGLESNYNGGPNAAIAAFFKETPAAFEVDRKYCDMFGRNATYNPNGYLRKC